MNKWFYSKDMNKFIRCVNEYKFSTTPNRYDIPAAAELRGIIDEIERFGVQERHLRSMGRIQTSLKKTLDSKRANAKLALHCGNELFHKLTPERQATVKLAVCDLICFGAPNQCVIGCPYAAFFEIKSNQK